MAKGISTVYGQGSMFRSRPMWSPDPTHRKNTKRKKKSVDPGVIAARQLFKNRLRLGGQLREALGVLKRQQRALEIANERFQRAQSQEDRLQYTSEIAALTTMISSSESKVAELRASLKATTSNQPVEHLAAEAQISAGVPVTPLSCPRNPPLQELGVPLPKERSRPEILSYLTRDGQAEFRSRMLQIHGKCVVTGCTDEAALEAAHIVPYVDARSNVPRNGLCMRADIHTLYDRNLITIADNFKIEVAECLRSPEYRSLHGKALLLDCKVEDMPCKRLLSVRHLIIDGELTPENL